MATFMKDWIMDNLNNCNKSLSRGNIESAEAWLLFAGKKMTGGKHAAWDGFCELLNEDEYKACAMAFYVVLNDPRWGDRFDKKGRHEK